MDVVDSKVKEGTQYTVTLTAEDLAALQGGTTLRMQDPETKLMFEAAPASVAHYVIECGPDFFAALQRALSGWLYVENQMFTMTLPGDSGKLSLRPLAVGAKTTRGTTVAAYTGELAP
jgi:hypothetical protein